MRICECVCVKRKHKQALKLFLDENGKVVFLIMANLIKP